MTHTRRKILVVDDLPDWRVTLNGLLSDEGYDVRVAGSLPQALELLGTDQFDLAVLDIRLDETDEDNTEGLDLAAKINERWPGVKIIIITGYGTPEIMKRVFEPDAQGQKLAVNYIPKTETEDLVRIVRETLA
ncbi:MAG: response regulator [Proteobacteria bacterium]|nr:response regulator [Pseudomonadota bacterium]